jgi:hypothetical protein
MIRRIPPLHPFLLALIPVCSMYAGNVGVGQGREFLVSSALVLLVTAVFYAVAALAFRNPQKGALLVSTFLVLLLVYDTVFGGIDRWEIAGWRFGRQRYALLACYGFLACVAVSLYRTRRPLATINGFLTVVTAGMLLVPAFTVVPTYLGRELHAQSDSWGQEPLQSSRQPSPLPDIYYLIFDRYGDARTIQDSYGYDNRPFYRYLQAKGFYVADSSRSNYIKTPLSLASSLNLTLLDDSTLGASPDSTDWASSYRMLEHHRLGRFLQARGYTYVHAGSWWWPTRRNAYAARKINSYPWTPRPVLVLLDSGLVHQFLYRMRSPWLDDRRQQWNRVNLDMAELGTVPALPGPKFVFAHVLVPHPPYVFNRDGSFLTESDANRHTDQQSYVNQLIATNTKITALIDHILSDSKTPPIIVLQGDEGPYPLGTREGRFNWHGATRAQLLEKSGILNAYYLPGGKSRLLYPSITPVNSFRVILNEYFGTGLPLLPDNTYAHQSDYGPYNFLDITQVVHEQ